MLAALMYLSGLGSVAPVVFQLPRLGSKISVESSTLLSKPPLTNRIYNDKDLIRSISRQNLSIHFHKYKLLANDKVLNKYRFYKISLFGSVMSSSEEANIHSSVCFKFV